MLDHVRSHREGRLLIVALAKDPDIHHSYARATLKSLMNWATGEGVQMQHCFFFLFFVFSFLSMRETTSRVANEVAGNSY